MNYHTSFHNQGLPSIQVYMGLLEDRLPNNPTERNIKQCINNKQWIKRKTDQKLQLSLRACGRH